MDFLRKIETPAYVALRFMAGFMFLFHGLQKLFGLFTDRATATLFSQSWWGGGIELLTGGLIAIGLFTRPAAFLASGTMAVAFFQFHMKGQFASWKFLPVNNGGELSVLYCFVFLFIASRGAGRWSLDRS